MSRWINIIYLLFVMLFTSCASTSTSIGKTLFTNDVRSSLEAKNIDLTKLQYYIDGDVLLSREISSDTAKITSGEVVFENGKYYQTITLKRNTPGVCTMVYPNRLNVSFDVDNNKYLTFSPSNTSTYQVVNNTVLSNNANTVMYDGVPYSIKFSSAPPYLLIKKSNLSTSSSNTRIMKGRKVN